MSSKRRLLKDLKDQKGLKDHWKKIKNIYRDANALYGFINLLHSKTKHSAFLLSDFKRLQTHM